MTVQSQAKQLSRSVTPLVRDAKGNENLEIAGANVRVDPPASTLNPHVANNFGQYVDWLASNKKTVAENSTSPKTTSRKSVATGSGQGSVAKSYVFSPKSGHSDVQQPYFRIDAKHTISAPISIERFRQEHARKPQESPVDSRFLRGFPTTVDKSLAQWEVTDFRWPVAVERLIYQQPKLAMLLLNQCTRFVRPNANRLLICGNGRQQGASTIAIGLARWASENGKRVLLVDADLSNPTLALHLGLEQSFDLCWVQGRRNDLPLAEMTVESNRTKVGLLPLKLTPGKIGSRAALDELGALIDEVALKFDLIVVDCGSANQLMNSLTRADRLADSLVLVHNRKMAAPELYLQTTHRLKHFGISKLVVAENFSDVRS